MLLCNVLVGIRESIHPLCRCLTWWIASHRYLLVKVAVTGTGFENGNQLYRIKSIKQDGSVDCQERWKSEYYCWRTDCVQVTVYIAHPIWLTGLKKNTHGLQYSDRSNDEFHDLIFNLGTKIKTSWPSVRFKTSEAEQPLNTILMDIHDTLVANSNPPNYYKTDIWCRGLIGVSLDDQKCTIWDHTLQQ